MLQTYNAVELQAILCDHLKWLYGELGGKRANLEGVNLRGANLRGVNLEHINLEGANLEGANLRGADLEGAHPERANLRDAILEGANLRGANLRGANLEGAILEDAILEGANLRGANLRGANLEGAILEDAILEGMDGLNSVIMPGGYTFTTYKAELVPALLAAGGRDPREFVDKAWACHSWDNCPMAEAFMVQSSDAIPLLYREQAQLFIQLFDAGLIPKPEFSD